MLARFFSVLIALIVLIPSICAADQVYFYHTDPAGTPLAMTDSTGAVVWKGDYKPFGEENSTSGAAANDRRFVGKEKDEESGLSYFGARYEDAKIGRFISPDPVTAVDPKSNKTNEALLLNPQRLNAYAYGLNNPYRYIDPDGRIAIADDAVIGMTMLTIATTGYLQSPAGQAALHNMSSTVSSLTQKMNQEIARIKEKAGGPQGIQYSLRASESGEYPNVRGGTTYLNAGDVWKYGETTNPDNRYSQSWLRANNLNFVPEQVGNQVEIKVAEKMKIYSYAFSKGQLPPGNKIFR